MNLNQKAFTIVELLIVIVVIAILASITIVSYNGVQNRAKTTAAKALAANVNKAVEVHVAETGLYPSQAELTSTSLVKISSSAFTVGGATPTNEKQIKYSQCTGAAGAQIIHKTFPTGEEFITLGMCS